MARRQKQNPVDEEDERFDHNLEDEMDDSPPSIDPYEVLGLETEATSDDVKKAYRKLALKHHPDKAPESDKTAANKKFQDIAFAYAVLSDEGRRKRYDLTGSTAESLEGDEAFDWLSFYRTQFEDVVTQENIKRISDDYKDGDQERNDILDAYTKYKGRLDKIYDSVMLSDILEDDDRFRHIIDEEIEKGTIESFPAYERDNSDTQREKAKAAERKRREDFDKKHGTDAADKAKAKQKGKKKGAGDMGDLAALIQQRQKQRMGGFFDHLETKYAPKSRGKKRGPPMDDPLTEEEFQASKKRMEARAKNNRATKKKAAVEYDSEEDDVEEDIVESDEEEEESEEERPKPKKRAKSSNTRARARAKA